MDASSLKGKFAEIGARLTFLPPKRRRSVWGGDRFQIDIDRNRHGEVFRVNQGRTAEVVVMDVAPRLRHLLLMVRQESLVKSIEEWSISKYLCGHDERHWFFAGVRSGPGTSHVRGAMEALKPALVRDSQTRQGVKRAARHKRRNAGFVRQGEWFFIPAVDLVVDRRLVLRDEPLRLGRRTPHMAQFAYRTGGVKVYVSRGYPNGLEEADYCRLLNEHPALRRSRWHIMTREPALFVQGRVRHPDHRTVVLPSWHRVVPNTESALPWGGVLGGGVFLD